MSTPHPTQRMYTLREVADWLCISLRQLRRWRSRGLIQVTYLDGSRRLPRVTQEAFRAFLQKRLKSKKGGAT